MLERQRAISRQRRVPLGSQQTRENDASAGGDEPSQWCGQPLQRSEQDIGEDEAERRPYANAVPGDTLRLCEGDECAHTIEPNVGLSDADCFRIDVGCQHALAHCAGGRNSKQTAACAEIENS